MGNRPLSLPRDAIRPASSGGRVFDRGRQTWRPGSDSSRLRRADEYNRSFPVLALSPTVRRSVQPQNRPADHLDISVDLADISATFAPNSAKKLRTIVPPRGRLQPAQNAMKTPRSTEVYPVRNHADDGASSQRTSSSTGRLPRLSASCTTKKDLGPGRSQDFPGRHTSSTALAALLVVLSLGSTRSKAIGRDSPSTMARASLPPAFPLLASNRGVVVIDDTRTTPRRCRGRAREPRASLSGPVRVKLAAFSQFSFFQTPISKLTHAHFAREFRDQTSAGAADEIFPDGESIPRAEQPILEGVTPAGTQVGSSELFAVGGPLGRDFAWRGRARFARLPTTLIVPRARGRRLFVMNCLPAATIKPIRVTLPIGISFPFRERCVMRTQRAA